MRFISKKYIPTPLLGVRGMGRPIQYYAGGSHRSWRWSGLFMAVGGVICLIWAAFHAAVRWINFGLAAIWELSWFLFALGGLLFVSGCLVYFIGFALPEKMYMSYQGGLVCSQGNRLFIWRWEDFTSLLIDSRSRRTTGLQPKEVMRLNLCLKQGGFLRIGPAVNGIGGLYDEIRARLYPRWHAEVEQTLRRGGTVHFGPLAVSQHAGIIYQERTLTWNDLEKITVEEGKLAIYTNRSPGSMVVTLPIKEIPNLEIFAGLVKPYLAVMAPEGG